MIKYKNITAKALKMGEMRFTRAPRSLNVGSWEKKFQEEDRTGFPVGEEHP